MYPRNDISSFPFWGTGHVLTASSLSGAMEVPFPLTNLPRKSTSSLKKWHFLGLSFKWCRRKRSKTLRKADNVSLKLIPRTMTSSRYTMTSSHSKPRKIRSLSFETWLRKVQKPMGRPLKTAKTCAKWRLLPTVLFQWDLIISGAKIQDKGQFFSM